MYKEKDKVLNSSQIHYLLTTNQLEITVIVNSVYILLYFKPCALNPSINFLPLKILKIIKMKNIYVIGIGISMLLASCGGSEEQTEQQNETIVENCIYTYNPALTKLDWTAYKFLRKAGVGGTFTTINVEGEKSSANPKSIIESLSFSIPVNSVETNDPGRNKKIDSLFFGKLNNTALLSGKVVSLGENGKAILLVTMNDISNEVEGDYTLVDNLFTFNTEIDVNKWNAQSGIESLNEACKDLHTDVENGDTESKLWSDVTISFSTELTKKCN